MSLYIVGTNYECAVTHELLSQAVFKGVFRQAGFLTLQIAAHQFS